MPGDFYVWLPDKRIVFSGDFISTQRMLAVSQESNTAKWIEVFEDIEAHKPKYIVPGHGHVTNITKAKEDTYTLFESVT